MAERALLDGAHFTERPHMTVRLKDRVIAKPFRPTRRPDDVASDLSLEEDNLLPGAGECDRTDEPRRSIRCALLSELILDPLHGPAEIPWLPGPAGGINPRISAQRIHGQAGIISEAGQAGRLAGRPRLQRRITAECRFGFIGFRQIEVAGALQGHPEQCKNLLHLLDLARIMAGENPGFMTHFSLHQSHFISPFEKFISKNDIFRLRPPIFLFIDKQQGRETSSEQHE